MGAELKLNSQLDGEDKAKAPAIEPEIKEEVENTSKDQPETEPEAKEAKKSGKHLVTFIGNGVWTDAKGEMWHKNHPTIKKDRTFTDKEFKERDDLKFMIGYGAMEHREI